MGNILPITTPVVNKDDAYSAATRQIDRLLRTEPDIYANLANGVAILRFTFGFYWVGFYFRHDTDLVLGPFQGPEACARIPIIPVPRGICGQAAADARTIVVAETNDLPDHLAVHAAEHSEIAVPLVTRGQTELVLNIKALVPASFDITDEKRLENIMRLIGKTYYRALSPLRQ